MTSVVLHPTKCPICDTEENATQIYEANFNVDSFSAEVFSARRLPDRVHYSMVRCNSCGLYRSDPVADPSAIAYLYGISNFDYGAEVHNLAHTYGSYLARLDRHGVDKGSIIEIGCGNGFLLEQACKQGWRDVHGVEPSRDAIDQAPADIGSKILCDMMRPGLFPANFADAICLFQVLDHVLDPAGLLKECFQILKPGGLMLCLNHNIRAISARLMKEKSPIIDIEHSFLYSPATIQRLFQRFGFDVRETGSATNRYSLGYLTRLIPIPPKTKALLSGFVEKTGLNRITLTVPLGNLYMIAQKPVTDL
jgi:SAM-dependent methyltransferase